MEIKIVYKEISSRVFKSNYFKVLRACQRYRCLIPGAAQLEITLNWTQLDWQKNDRCKTPTYFLKSLGIFENFTCILSSVKAIEL